MESFERWLDYQEELMRAEIDEHRARHRLADQQARLVAQQQEREEGEERRRQQHQQEAAQQPLQQFIPPNGFRGFRGAGFFRGRSFRGRGFGFHGRGRGRYRGGFRGLPQNTYNFF